MYKNLAYLFITIISFNLWSNTLDSALIKQGINPQNVTVLNNEVVELPSGGCIKHYQDKLAHYQKHAKVRKFLKTTLLVTASVSVQTAYVVFALIPLLQVEGSESLLSSPEGMIVFLFGGTLLGAAGANALYNVIDHEETYKDVYSLLISDTHHTYLLNDLNKKKKENIYTLENVSYALTQLNERKAFCAVKQNE